jgi:hypothetical protein
MLKHAAQLCGIIFSMLLHLVFINITIAKAQAQYHTHYQYEYELVFSKWPTIMKISGGFLARSAGNTCSDFLKIKNKFMQHEKWMRAR